MSDRLRTPSAFPIHPILLSAYPICYLYSRNAVFVPPSDTVRTLALSIGVAAAFLMVFRLILKDWGRAGLLTSLLAILCYSFGHVASIVAPAAMNLGLAYKESALGLAWLVCFVIVSLVIVQKGSSPFLVRWLNLASVVLIAVPIMSAVTIRMALAPPSEAELHELAVLRGDADAQSLATFEPGGPAPDIYHIILDGYERADVLLEAYGYDNSEFIAALTERGFFIAEDSRANYLSTNYSLSTALNLVYFQDLPPGIQRNAGYNLRANYVTDFLRQQGYRVIVFDSGTGNTNDQYFDEFVAPEAPSSGRVAGLNPFELLLLRTTLARLMMGAQDPAGELNSSDQTVRDSVNRELSIRRERIRHAFLHLPDFASRQGAHFLFAHIYLPHIPFLYGPAGEELEYRGNLNVNWYVVPPDDFPEYYGYQIDYVNCEVLEVIDRILRSSSGPVVIILQADHGDDSLLDWERPDTRGVAARSSILNAIYFSDGDYRLLYPSITPVNTYRVVFNRWFGTRYPLLRDRTFVHEHPVSSTYGEVPEFRDACETYGVCSPVHLDSGLGEMGE